MNLQVRLIDSTSELGKIKRSWDELYDSIPPPQGHPFNCFSWLFPYAMLLERQGSLLQVFAVFEGDKLVGIAPLQIPRTKLLGFKRVQFIGHDFSDYCDFICRKEYEAVVAQTLLGHWQSVFGVRAVFDLNQFHESSATPLFLQAEVAKLGGQVCEIPWEKALALSLTDGNGTDILDRILSKKHCRQRTREMEKLGKAEFLVFASEDGLQSHLERLFYYHRLRWHQRKTWVHSMDEAIRNAYVLCICQMAHEGHAEIVALTVDDCPYAYALALKKDNFFYYLVPVHNVFSRYSPGTSLLYCILRYVREHGYGELDFTIGEEPYKTRFSNVVRHNRRLFFTFNQSGAFAIIIAFINYVRSNKALLEHTRYWRTKSNHANYSVKDNFSRWLARLRRLDYEAVQLHMKSIISNSRCHIYQLDIANDCHFEGAGNNLRIQRISINEAIKFVSSLHQCDSPGIWGELLKRDMEGAECYGAFIDNQLIHTSWVTDDDSISIEEIGDSLDLEVGECCVFDCNTLAEYRGCGAYPETLRHIAHCKKASGYNSLYIYTLSSNASSIRGIEKAGFQLVDIREAKARRRRFWR